MKLLTYLAKSAAADPKRFARVDLPETIGRFLLMPLSLATLRLAFRLSHLAFWDGNKPFRDAFNVKYQRIMDERILNGELRLLSDD